jgi:hypothetical protein
MNLFVGINNDVRWKTLKIKSFPKIVVLKIGDKKVLALHIVFPDLLQPHFGAGLRADVDKTDAVG